MSPRDVVLGMLLILGAEALVFTAAVMVYAMIARKRALQRRREMLARLQANPRGYGDEVSRRWHGNSVTR